MTPQPRDVVEMIAHLRWFLRLGPQPRFDHFTYWEKFDYWAVFWGMGVIGGSGLVLWFPEFFSRFLPGSWFTVALLIHGEEGLLAVGFIFTIHFFNSHLRPDKFPMDPVIFTGRITAHELQEERPAEYERLRAAGLLDEIEVGPAPSWLPRLAKAVALGAEPRGEADGANHAQLVLGEAMFGLADGADNAGLQVIAPANEIQNFVGVGIE